MIILAFRVDARSFYRYGCGLYVDLGCWPSNRTFMETPDLLPSMLTYHPIETRGRGLRSGDICENGDEG